MAWIYILKSQTSRYYVGSTTDLARRLNQHKNGHTHTTVRMSGFELVFSQEFATLYEARKIENRIKKLKRRDYIESIIGDGKINMSR